MRLRITIHAQERISERHINIDHIKQAINHPDTISDAAYLKVNSGKVLKTTEIKEGIVVDMGKKGKIIGIEILNFSLQQSARKLKESMKNGLPVEIISSMPSLA
jgi:uncharacterized protein YuzE